jgi:copper chaperone CopZ
MLRHGRANGTEPEEGDGGHSEAQLDHKRVEGLGSGVRTTLRLRLPSIHAIRAIYTALQGVEGIVHAAVSRGVATIEHDGRATAERLREAVASAGYEVMEIVEERRRLTVRNEE